MSIHPLSKKALSLGAPLPFHILLSILVYAVRFYISLHQHPNYSSFSLYIYMYKYINVYMYITYIYMVYMYIYVAAMISQPLPHIFFGGSIIDGVSLSS
jgi:hypothetical protein